MNKKGLMVFAVIYLVDFFYPFYNHRRRIKTEEKAKVVAAVWGTEFIQFLAALAILHYRTILENRMNSSFCLIHLGACNSSYSSSRPSAKQLAGQGQGIL